MTDNYYCSSYMWLMSCPKPLFFVKFRWYSLFKQVARIKVNGDYQMKKDDRSVITGLYSPLSTSVDISLMTAHNSQILMNSQQISSPSLRTFYLRLLQISTHKLTHVFYHTPHRILSNRCRWNSLPHGLGLKFKWFTRMLQRLTTFFQEVHLIPIGISNLMPGRRWD